MARGYYLTDDTLRKVRRVINRPVGTNTMPTYGHGSRLVLWVRVTEEELGSASSGSTTREKYYKGFPTAYNAVSKSWDEYDEVNVKASDDEELELGKRYLGVRHGEDTDGNIWFIVDPKCCGGESSSSFSISSSGSGSGSGSSSTSTSTSQSNSRSGSGGGCPSQVWYSYRPECEDGILNVYAISHTMAIVDGCLDLQTGEPEFSHEAGRCDCCEGSSSSSSQSESISSSGSASDSQSGSASRSQSYSQSGSSSSASTSYSNSTSGSQSGSISSSGSASESQSYSQSGSTSQSYSNSTSGSQSNSFSSSGSTSSTNISESQSYSQSGSTSQSYSNSNSGSQSGSTSQSESISSSGLAGSTGGSGPTNPSISSASLNTNCIDTPCGSVPEQVVYRLRFRDIITNAEFEGNDILTWNGDYWEGTDTCEFQGAPITTTLKCTDDGWEIKVEANDNQHVLYTGPDWRHEEWTTELAWYPGIDLCGQDGEGPYYMSIKILSDVDCGGSSSSSSSSSFDPVPCPCPDFGPDQFVWYTDSLTFTSPDSWRQYCWSTDWGLYNKGNCEFGLDYSCGPEIGDGISVVLRWNAEGYWEYMMFDGWHYNAGNNIDPPVLIGRYTCSTQSCDSGEYVFVADSALLSANFTTFPATITLYR